MRIRAFLDDVFPERQFFVRSEGRVRYLSLSQRLQISLLIMALIGAGAVTWSTVLAVFNREIITAKNAHIDRLAEEKDVVATELDNTAGRLDHIAGELKKKYAQLQATVEQQELLDRKLKQAVVELRRAAGERDAALTRGEDLDRRIADLETDLRRTIDRNNTLEADLGDAMTRVAQLDAESRSWQDTSRQLREQVADLDQRLLTETNTRRDLELSLESTTQQLAVVSEERDSAIRTGDELGDRLTEVTDDLTDTRVLHERLARTLSKSQHRLDITASGRDAAQQQVKSLRKQIAQLTSALAELEVGRADAETQLSSNSRHSATLTAARDHAERRAELLANQLVHMESQLNGVKYHQRQLFEWLGGQLQRNAEMAERSLRITGLDVAELTRAATGLPYGQGGPLVVAGAPSLEVDAWSVAGETMQGQVTRLEMQLVRWNGVINLIRQMPIGRPTDRGWISSRFGKRRDPFTRGWAMHHGLDIAAPPRTPIYAPAPGVVTRAGTNGAYGYFIEIDHGMGFKTRYGHLRKMLVKRGEKVSYRQQIAQMGSSGRSSGPHLHYEVVYRGQNQDPAKFVEAGNYVFQEREE